MDPYRRHDYLRRRGGLASALKRYRNSHSAFPQRYRNLDNVGLGRVGRYRDTRIYVRQPTEQRPDYGSGSPYGSHYHDVLRLVGQSHRGER